MTQPADKPRRGRPPTGKAKSGAERQAAHAERQRKAGVRRVSVTLTPADEAALTKVVVRDGHETDQSAIVASIHANAARKP